MKKNVKCKVNRQKRKNIYMIKTFIFPPNCKLYTFLSVMNRLSVTYNKTTLHFTLHYFTQNFTLINKLVAKRPIH